MSRGTCFARTLRATVGQAITIAFRTRVIGKKNIPAGGAILAGNHLSYMDPVLLWCVSPRFPHFMAKRELWDVGFLAWLLPKVLAFPVSRGAADRTAIEKATELLRDGELVGIFPEGSRATGEGDALGEAHGGAAFLALRADVPIVPVAFVGTDVAMPRGAKLPRFRRTFISIGKPIYPGEIEAGGRKQRVEALTALLMERIALELTIAKAAAE